MGETIDGYEKFGELAKRFRAMFQDMAPDLELMGKNGAETIVRTTLAGIGEGDKAFAPYSPAYKALIEAAGGKPQGTVNLRGIFYHKGQKRPHFSNEKRRRAMGEGTRSRISVLFPTRGLRLGGHGLLIAFEGRTPMRRPNRGVNDPLSEMSLDLIKVAATDTEVTITYRPRAKPYMIYHNEGTARGAPQRKWFTLAKAGVLAGMHKVLRVCMQARAARVMGEEAAAAVDNPGPTT